jgi:hypothetical protein
MGKHAGGSSLFVDNELQADLLQVFCSAAILKIVDDGGENRLSVPHPEIKCQKKFNIL